MSISKFEDLEVYKLAEQLGDNFRATVWDWNNLAKNTIGKQIINSSDSISANIAEGYGRGTFAERSRFAKISRGSLFETKSWANKAIRRRLITKEKYDELNEVINVLMPKLSAYINYLNRNIKKRNPK